MSNQSFSTIKSICFFGSYDRNYAKNVVLINGFEKKDIEIIHVFHPNYFTLNHYPSLFDQFIKKARNSDLIFVAFFGHYDVWFAWLIGILFGKKVIFDPLISIYNTRVQDRKYFSTKSFRAKFYIFFDKMNIILSNKVLLDSEEHFKYYQKMFGLKRSKTLIIRTGADEKILKPKDKKVSPNISILFYGSYQPSQGAMNIIKVADELKKEKINWTFIGEGQQRPEVEKFAQQKKLKNVKFIGFMPFTQLKDYIDKTDILFGVFGDTVKTRMVIHNKIYQGLAMGKAVITQDTPAVREILVDGKNVILVKPKIDDIKNRLSNLLKDKKLIRSIGENARTTYLQNFTSKQITDKLIKELE